MENVSRILNDTDFNSSLAILLATPDPSPLPPSSPRQPADLWGIVTMLTITVITVVGNALLCWILFSNPHLWTIPNQLVMNLAVCDLLMAVINAPFTVVTLAYGGWVLGDVMCQLNGFLTTLFGVAAVITLAAISINRCCMIVYTHECASLFTKTKTKIMILGIWVLSAACAFPPVVGWSHYTFIPGKAICTLIWSTDVTYTFVVLVLGVFLPFFAMVFSYLKIFLKVRDSHRKIGSSFEKGAKISSETSEGCWTRKHNKQEPIQQDGKHENAKDVSVIKTRNLPSETFRQVPLYQMAFTPHRSNETLDSGESNRSNSNSNSNTSSPIGDDVFVESSENFKIYNKVPGVFHSNPSTVHRKRFSSDSNTRKFSIDMPSLSSYCDVAAMRTQHKDGSQTLPQSKRLSLDSIFESGKSCIQQTYGDKSGLNPTASKSASRSLMKFLKEKTNLNSNGSTTSAEKNASMKNKRHGTEDIKLTFTLLVVILVFVISWAPISTVNFLETFAAYTIPVHIDRLTVYMVFGQSALNPIIYGVMNKNFREGYLSLLSCKTPIMKPCFGHYCSY